MVAKRLMESVLFLETRCNSDADKEYVEAIRCVIEEHALLRETLENICLEKNVEDIFVMASSALGQAAGNTIDANVDLNEALSKISKLLPSDKQLEEMSNAKLLIGELLA